MPRGEPKRARAIPLKLKAQILCGDEIAMGPGKADLLEAIERNGSISAAGRALGMSYRRSWLLVDTMNRCWTRPLVEAVPGGGRERGARVTDLGKEVLRVYRALEAGILAAATDSDAAILASLLRSVPVDRER